QFPIGSQVAIFKSEIDNWQSTMINGIIGKKVGMTQLFAPDGTVMPVTVIKAGPCVVVQKKSAGGKDGYDAVQVGLVEDRPIKLKNVNKPMRGHFERSEEHTSELQSRV